MGGHVVRALVVVGVERRVLGRGLGRPAFEVAPRGRRRILLDQQRCRRVAAEQGQETGSDRLVAEPALDLAGDLVQPLPRRSDLDGAEGLAKHASQVAVPVRQCQRVATG